MKTRNFTYNLLELIFTNSEVGELPEGIKIKEQTHEYNGVWTYSTFVFKIEAEWKFYKFYTQYNARRDALCFAGVDREWSDDAIIECKEVVPHLTQTVVYEDAEDE